ncbi:hypothetical protein DFH29DRAFT_881149 [Suillus ampliporus]|nr:hypothetical protein DFH29DRAFT_881149 [Suillus ampliporus]
MARTKQTSGKSTGGPAKRGETTSGFLQIIKSVNAKALPIGLAKTIPSAIEGMIKPQVWNLSRRRILKETMLSSDAQGVTKFVTNVLARTSIHHIFLTSPISYFNQGFEDAEGKPVLARPAVIHGHIELSSRSEICTIPVLILNFVLDSVDRLGSPACIMRDALHSYVPADYREIVFDVGTAHKAKQHAKSMAKLVSELGPHQVGRVEIFIHSHSETIRGDIWGGFKNVRTKGERGDPVAYMISDFFTLVFAGGMADYVKGATLWMLVCGHVVREIDAFNDFKDCIKHYQIQHTFVFGAERFHACLAGSFTIAYVEHVLIQGFEVQDTMEELLAVSRLLGMHTSITHVHLTNAFRRRDPYVIEFNKGAMHVDDKASMVLSTYTFFHENQRPWGNPLPYQYSRCHSVRPWNSVTSSLTDKAQFACKNCSCNIAFMRPKQSKIILFTNGYQGTSNVSGKLLKKGSRAGSGWLVLVAIERASQPLLDHVAADQ